MIVGFDQRYQNVSENAGVDFFPLLIGVSTVRISERNYKLEFHYEQNSSTAVVEALTHQHNPEYDALFGTRLGSDDPIMVTYLLKPGQIIVPSLMTIVKNDLRLEDSECYTISIFSTVSNGLSCNEDGSSMNGFFCYQTLCILNDDGQFTSVLK